MAIIHSTTKTHGQKLFAVADWNANHDLSQANTWGALNTFNAGIALPTNQKISWDTDTYITADVSGAAGTKHLKLYADGGHIKMDVFNGGRIEFADIPGGVKATFQDGADNKALWLEGDFIPFADDTYDLGIDDAGEFGVKKWKDLRMSGNIYSEGIYYDSGTNNIHINPTAISAGGETQFTGQVGIGMDPVHSFDLELGSNCLSGSSIVPGGVTSVTARPSDVDGGATGIGFRHSTNAYNIGASVGHIRRGSYSQGDFFIATKATTGHQDNLPINMTIQGSTGNVTIGALTPTNASAKLDIVSTTGALLVSRMTTAQRDALTAANGMILYNTSTNAFNFYENGAWVSGSGLA